MSPVTFVLRNVLYDQAECCGLCFKSIGENDTSFNIEDEVLLDIEKTEVIYQILSTVLGDIVLGSIPTHMICQKCAEIAINSYKFVQQCRNNVQHLNCTIEALQKHTKDINEQTNDYKSVFLALDASNHSVEYYYDKNRNGNSTTTLFERFQKLKKQYQELFIEIELEVDYSTNHREYAVKRKKHTSKLQSHQLAEVHNKDDLTSYKCKACLNLYKTAMNLKLHYLRVHAPKDFKCSQCPRSFGSLLLLKRHTKDSHCTIVCSKCGKTYTNMFSLRYHERSHKSSLICQTCGKIYKGKMAFNNHIKMKLCTKMRKSNTEAKLTCDYCGKKYSQKTALSVHIRLEHDNGKALICDWCGKKFSSISRLKGHIIKHTKQKNFECEMCGGKFATKTSLLYHTRIHTGEKPYKCEYCDISFISASRRLEHTKRHHTATNLECDICHSKFKGNTSLMRHRKKHFDVRSRLYYKPPSLVMLSSK